MSTFVYKVNPKGAMGRYVGDWFDFFSGPPTSEWGLAAIVCAFCHPASGDRIICHQSNIGEVVGTASVVGYRMGSIVLRATEGPFPRGIKIGDLKKIDDRIQTLDAFRQGFIRTLYPIGDDDADHLLNTIKRFWIAAVA